MIQKNYSAKDFGELKWSLQEILASEAYHNAETVLAQVYIENWVEQTMIHIMSTIRVSLTKAVVVGMTNMNRELYFTEEDNSETDKGTVIIDLLCFDSTKVDVHIFDHGSMPELVAGGKLGYWLSKESAVKGVHLMAAGDNLAIEDFLTMAAAENPEVVFFGQTASSGNWKGHSRVEAPMGFIWYQGQMFSRGIAAVVFKGKDFHIRTGYNFGWTPIGKKMTVTKMENERVVSEIDGVPAAYVYKKYFGLESSQLITENVCEFPFAVERGERLLARIGLGTDDPDTLLFSGHIFEGDELQLTYGDPEVIFTETYADSMEVRRFQPQAIQLIECLNRSVLLKREIHIEHDFYLPIAGDLMITHGNSEILFDAKGGGELNSALISVAMREGDAPEPPSVVHACDRSKAIYERKTIPLVHRMTRFLEATTHDLKEAVERSAAANRAKTRFLSNISHEIRTPINAILGLDELIVRESSEVQIRRYAMDIQNSGRTLLALINDLLDSSRIESGKMEIIPVEYDLSSMLNDLVNMTGVRAKEKGLVFHVNVAPDIPHVLFGDDTRIKQCVLNILTNAVKYTNSGSVTMEVSFEKMDNDRIGLSFSVKDTGIGIRKEDIPKLFTAYERIEEERNHLIEGTGLGMNIVKTLLEMMGSALEVQSVYGEGSTFSFMLEQGVRKWEPIGNFSDLYHQSVEETQHYHEGYHAPEARILVVDDTRMNLTVIRGLLAKTKIGIDTAESGRETLALVRENRYDVIFLDQRMPEMDGIETFRRMRHMYDNKNHGVPVIMLTANAVTGAREKFLEEGFDDYLSKPVNGKKLEQMLRQYLPADKVIPVGPQDEDTGRGGSGSGVSGAYTDGGEEVFLESASGEVKENLPESDFIKHLSLIEGFSVEDGLNNCMDADFLRETIRDFLVAAKEGPKLIEGLLATGNIKDYVIRVHALKSSARIIGANVLSKMAQHLEESGDDDRIDELHARTPELLEAYIHLTHQLQNVLEGRMPEDKGDANTGEGTQSRDDLPELEKEQEKEALNGVRELIEAFDFDGAADILEMLSGFRLSDQTRALRDTLSDHIVKLERDSILELLKR